MSAKSVQADLDENNARLAAIAEQLAQLYNASALKAARYASVQMLAHPKESWSTLVLAFAAQAQAEAAERSAAAAERSAEHLDAIRNHLDNIEEMLTVAPAAHQSLKERAPF